MTIVALGAILVVAVILRFYGLAHQGFMVFDDGAYVVAAQGLTIHAPRVVEKFYTIPKDILMRSELYHRPGFIFLVILGSSIVGFSPFAGAVVSAVLGVLTVGVVYGITRRLFTRWAALIATALFATSTWHIFHSRVGLSNATAVFFFTAGLYYWLQFTANRSRSIWSPLVAGFLFGYAFTSHYSLLSYLSVGLLLELWLAARERAYRGTVVLLVASLAPLAGFYALTGYEVWRELYRLVQGTQSSPDPMYYLRLLWRYETLPFIVFSLVGAIRAVQTFRQRPFDREASLYALCFASFLLLSLQAAGGHARPRVMAPLFPLFAVLSGGAATLLMESGLVKRGQPIPWGAACGLILLAGLVANRGFFTWHSGFEVAVDALRTRYPIGRYACAGWWPICDFYTLGPEVHGAPPLETLTPRAEFLFAHSIARDQHWDRGVFGLVPGRLVAQFENPVEQDPRIGEETGSGAAHLGVIRIYDLRPARRAAQGDTAAVESPLTVPTDPNGKDTTGTTPLMRAAALGHTVTLRALLAKGAEVNATGPGGVTALMAAAFHGHTAAAAVLLAAGADSNVRAQGGGTALMAAAANGHTATAAALLAAGVDLHAKRQDGATALRLAASSGHPVTAAFLAQAGRTSQKGGGPLLQALQQMNIPLSEGALIERAARGDTQAVELLLVTGMNPNAHDTLGTTALMAAAANGHTAIVEALLAAGADVNMKNPEGETALLVTAVMGHPAILAALAAAGADINAKRRDGMTALILAAANGHPTTVTGLLAAGADTNARTRTGWTALMWASQDGYTTIVGALLVHGADVNAKQTDIQAEWSNGGTALMLAAANGHLSVVQALLASGADVNASTRSEATALMTAAVDGHAAIVEALLAHGAKVNARQVNGWTALMGAAESGHVTIVQALLAKGADVQATYRKTTTALKLAEERGHTTIVELLRQAGAGG